ncbi:conserved hypothetical protein [Uncinocarpus reesii 1704]|uniref:N-acetyltransferase domain-containing protein n=1 Tax=Uncinocarpus reesii (strain UAMH 1704) TaxID=336963 RepID=C4JLF6_UNCRE|nr:uncharacterized protein UREG_03664 [Uncinocarpus reesii 1704]EEP78818.1 conserved hypothetical protein [Uncinocarpus reesii 1704]
MQDLVRLPAGYRLVEGTPDAVAYCHLRAASGLTPKTEEQGRLALAGTWYMCYVTYTPPDDGNKEQSAEVVGMGRIIGDGGWYFLIADIAVLPEHQRRGLGDAIMTTILSHLRSRASPGAWITLMADPPGRRLYQRHGFTETAPASIGMAIFALMRRALNPGQALGPVMGNIYSRVLDPRSIAAI